MASIKIANLQPTGLDLFSDSESYLTNLSEGELNDTNGGLTPAAVFFAGVAVGIWIADRT